MSVEVTVEHYPGNGEGYRHRDPAALEKALSALRWKTKDTVREVKRRAHFETPQAKIKRKQRENDKLRKQRRNSK